MNKTTYKKDIARIAEIAGRMKFFMDDHGRNPKTQLEKAIVQIASIANESLRHPSQYDMDVILGSDRHKKATVEI